MFLLLFDKKFVRLILFLHKEQKVFLIHYHAHSIFCIHLRSDADTLTGIIQIHLNITDSSVKRASSHFDPF